MKRAARLRDLQENPRVELVPCVLNVPILLALLVLLHLFPDFQPIINSEGANIFGINADYVGIMTTFIIATLVFVVILAILTIFFRKMVPAWLFLVPVALFFVYASIFSFVLNNNEYITINYIYQNLGPVPGAVLYLVVASLLVAAGLATIHGLPVLWNEAREATAPRFHPKALATITLAGFLLMALLLGLLLFGHPAMIFWHMLSYSVDGTSPLVIFHGISILVAMGAIACLKCKAVFVSKFHVGEPAFTKIAVVLLRVSLAVQGTIIILGIFFLDAFEGGLPAIILSPLSMTTYATCVFYLLDTRVFPMIDRPHLHGARGTTHRDVRATIVIAPLLWIVLFQPLCGVPPQPALPATNLVVVKNTYATLSTAQRGIFDTYMNSRFPTGMTVDELVGSSGTRDLSRLACGLLFRNATGDVDAASTIIAHLLPDVGAGNFVGCDMVMILEYYRELLAPGLVDAIEAALVECAWSQYTRNERPTYTNIAMMGALIMQYAGITMNVPALRDAGIRKSWEIYLLFTRNETLSEFNSPTYCGVDMLVLAMWRDLGPTDSMRRMGAIMEKALWREFAAFYHPGLKNFAGPYIRAYGMNMKEYYAITGIWIALAIDNITEAPLPDGLVNTYKYGELNFIFPAVQVGHSVPEASIVQQFTSITTSRHLERWLPTDISNLKKPYRVSATLHPEWMMGGVSGRLQESGQFFAGCIHWTSTDGSLAWLLVSGLDNLDVEVSGHTMTIRQNFRADRIVFYVECHDMTAGMFSGSTWDLPNISFGIGGEPSSISAVMADVPLFKATHDIAEPVHNLVKVTCLLDEIRLNIAS